jgi:hypothetical protein
MQHPLHEGAHVLVGEDEAGQFRDAGARHEHARCRVNPDFFNIRVIHERLQRAEPTDVIHEVRFDLLALCGEHVGSMSVNDAVDQVAHGPGVARRIDAARGQSLSNPRGECPRHGFHP